MRIIRTRRGARIVDRGLVLSEIIDAPGPTNSLFDVLAACVAALAPGVRVALLGFAGGGVVAPLRGMGFGHPLRAVDLSLDGEAVFRDVSGPWAGQVRVDQADAVAWLRRQRLPWDVILEDLSVSSEGDVTKPAVSLAVLPPLVKQHLAPRGIAVVNVLPVVGLSWREVLTRIARPWRDAHVVLLEDYENRVLLTGAIGKAREASRALGRHLAGIGSDQSGRLSVRTFKRGGRVRL